MNPNNCLDFENAHRRTGGDAQASCGISAPSRISIFDEIARLEAKSKALTDSVFASLTPWRDRKSPATRYDLYTLDYVERLFTDFPGIDGDRAFADDHAIVGGLARLDGQPVLVIGHQKGRRMGRFTATSAYPRRKAIARRCD